MVRGPRRGNATFHSTTAGPSIIELLEESLTEVCVQYRNLRTEWGPSDPHVREARGRIRGLAISVAMMRHPLRRYTVPWWNYVKKLEKRHLVKADERMADGSYTQT